jgi:hypothetical protein
MPIEISCKCGRTLNLRDELGGKTIRCPKCTGMLKVPLPVSEVVEEIVEGPPRQAVASGKRRGEIDLAPPPRRPEPPKESKKKKKKKGSVYSERFGDSSQNATILAFNEGWFGNLASGIVGGLITMLIGIIALVCFLTFTFYIRGIVVSIVVIVIGLIATLKGLMDLY